MSPKFFQLSRGRILPVLLALLLMGCARATPPASAPLPATHTASATASLASASATTSYAAASPTNRPSFTPTPSQAPTPASTNTSSPPEPVRLGALGKGEMDWVMRSADGKILLKAEPGQVRLFEAATEKEIGVIHAGVGPNFNIILSPDGQLAALSGAAGMPIYELSSAHLLEQDNFEACGAEMFEDMVFSPDNHYAVINGYHYLPHYEEKHLCLYNVQQGKYEFRFPGTESETDNLVRSIGAPAISPDSRRVAAGVEHNVYLWELASGKIQFVLEGHGADVSGAAFSPNGKQLASCSLDGTVRIWDTASGRLLRVVTGFTNDIERVAFSGDGRALIVDVKDGPQKTYNLQTGRFVPNEVRKNAIDPFARRLYQAGYTESDSRVLYSPDGRFLAVGRENVSLWDPAAKTVARVLESTSGDILRWTFSPDSRWLAALTDQGAVLVWNTRDGKLAFTQQSDLFSLPEREWYSAGPEPRGLAFSPGSDQLVFGSGSAITLWSVPGGRPLRALSLGDPLKLASQVGFSPDGKQLAALINPNEEVWIWDVKSLRLLRKISLPHLDQRFIKSALQWPWLMLGSSDGVDSQAGLWNLETGRVTPLLPPAIGGDPAQFSQDGQLLASVSGGQVYFYQTRTGQLISEKGLDQQALDLALSPDGHTFAISLSHYSAEEGSNTESVSLWDMQATFIAAQNPLAQPFALPTPTPTPTTKPADTQPRPTLQITPLPLPPLDDRALSPANAARIIPLASYSKGVIEQVSWSADNAGNPRSYLVAAAQGAYWHGLANGSLEPGGWTQSAAALPDGRLLAASVNQRQVQVWRSGSAQPVAVLPGRAPALSPDGRWLLYAPAKHALRLVDLQTGQVTATLRVGFPDGSPYRNWQDNYFYRQPAFSPDSRLAAVVHYGTSIRVWDVQSGTIVDGLGGPDKTITQYAFSADSAFIAAAAGGSAWLWRLNTHTLPQRFTIFSDESGIPMPDSPPPPPLVTAAAFEPMRQILAVGTNQGEILLIDAASQKVIRRLNGLTKTPDRLAFSPDGAMLLSTDTSGIINLWEVDSGKNLSRVTDYSGLPRGLSFRLNGDLAAWSDNVDQVLALPDLGLKQSIPVPAGTIFADSPDGKSIAVADAFKIQVWDPATGQNRQTAEGGTNWADANGFKKEDHGAVFSADGRRLAVVGTGGARVYDPSTGRQVHWLPADLLNVVTFSPDGKWLYTCATAYFSCTPTIQEISTEKVIQELEKPGDGNAEQAAFSPDGAQVAAALNEYDYGYKPPSNRLVRWDLATGAQINRLDFPGQALTSITYSPDGRLIAIGTDDGKIILVDAQAFQVAANLQGYEGSVLFLAFSPDGRYLASSGADGMIRSWGIP